MLLLTEQTNSDFLYISPLFARTMSALEHKTATAVKQTELNHYATGTRRPIGSLDSTIVALLFLQHNELGKHEPIVLSSRTRTLDSILLVGPFPTVTKAATTVIATETIPAAHPQTIKKTTVTPMQVSSPSPSPLQQQQVSSNVTPLLYPPATVSLFKRKLDKNRAWNL
jgi:hypothetical protein